MLGDHLIETRPALDLPAGAQAALVNVTVAGTAGPGFVRTWVPRALRSTTSTVNADTAGSFVANAAVVPVDADGAFMLEVATTTRIVVDVMGWFGETTTPDAGRFVALTPERVVDTREPAGAGNDFDRSGNTITVYPWGQGGAPSGEPAGAVVLSIGAISNPGTGGYVGAYPAGGTWAGTSNVNVVPADVRANTVVVPLGDDNGIDLRTLNIGDVVVDLVGYFTSDGASASGEGLFQFSDPTRMADTRDSFPFARLGVRTPRTLDVEPAGSAILQNVTVTRTSGPGWVATYPPSAGTPEISTVNFTGAGQTRAVLAFTKDDPNGDVSYESLVPTDLVVDLIGTFS